MNPFSPTITLTECADEIVARDRTAQSQYNAAFDALDASLDRQKEDYEARIDYMSCDYEDLETTLAETEAKLEDVLDGFIVSFQAKLKSGEVIDMQGRFRPGEVKEVVDGQ